MDSKENRKNTDFNQVTKVTTVEQILYCQLVDHIFNANFLLQIMFTTKISVNLAVRKNIFWSLNNQ